MYSLLVVISLVLSVVGDNSNFIRKLNKTGGFKRDLTYDELKTATKPPNNILFNNLLRDSGKLSCLFKSHNLNDDFSDETNTFKQQDSELQPRNAFKKYFTKIGWKSDPEQTNDDNLGSVNGHLNLKDEESPQVGFRGDEDKLLPLKKQLSPFDKSFLFQSFSPYFQNQLRFEDRNASNSNQELISSKIDQLTNTRQSSSLGYKWPVKNNFSDLFPKNVNKQIAKPNQFATKNAEENKTGIDSDKQLDSFIQQPCRSGLKKTVDPLINSIMLEPSSPPEAKTIKTSRKLFDLINHNSKDILNVSMIMNGLNSDKSIKSLDKILNSKTEIDEKSLLYGQRKSKNLMELFTRSPFYLNDQNKFRLKLLSQKEQFPKSYVRMMTNDTGRANGDGTEGPLLLIPLNKIRVEDPSVRTAHIDQKFRTNNGEKKVYPITEELQRLLNYNHMMGKQFGDLDLRGLLDLSSTNLNPMIPVLNLFVLAHPNKFDKKEEELFKKKMEDVLKSSKANLTYLLAQRHFMDQMNAYSTQSSPDADSTDSIETTTTFHDDKRIENTTLHNFNSFNQDDNRAPNKLQTILPILMATANMAYKKYSDIPKFYDSHVNGISMNNRENVPNKNSMSLKFLSKMNLASNAFFDHSVNKSHPFFSRTTKSNLKNTKEQEYYSKHVTTSEYSAGISTLSDYTYYQSPDQSSNASNDSYISWTTNTPSQIPLSDSPIHFTSTDGKYKHEQEYSVPSTLAQGKSEDMKDDPVPIRYQNRDNVFDTCLSSHASFSTDKISNASLDAFHDKGQRVLNFGHQTCHLYPPKSPQNNIIVSLTDQRAKKSNHSNTGTVCKVKGFKKFVLKNLNNKSNTSNFSLGKNFTNSTLGSFSNTTDLLNFTNSTLDSYSNSTDRLIDKTSGKKSLDSEVFNAMEESDIYNNTNEGSVAEKLDRTENKNEMKSRVDIPLVVQTGSTSRLVLFPLANASSIAGNINTATNVNQTNMALKLEGNNLNIVPIIDPPENRGKTTYQSVRVIGSDGTIDSYLLPNMYIDLADKNKTSIINGSGLSLKVVVSNSTEPNYKTDFKLSNIFQSGDKMLLNVINGSQIVSTTQYPSQRSSVYKNIKFNGMPGEDTSENQTNKGFPETLVISKYVGKGKTKYIESSPRLKTKVEHEGLQAKQLPMVVVAIDPPRANAWSRGNKTINLGSSMINQPPVKIYVLKQPSSLKNLLPESSIQRAFKPAMVWPNYISTDQPDYDLNQPNYDPNQPNYNLYQPNYDPIQQNYNYSYLPVCNAYQQQLWDYYNYCNQQSQNQCNTNQSECNTENPGPSCPERCRAEVTLFPVLPVYPVYPLNPLIQHSTCRSCQPSLTENRYQKISYVF